MRAARRAGAESREPATNNAQIGAKGTLERWRCSRSIGTVGPKDRWLGGGDEGGGIGHGSRSATEDLQRSLEKLALALYRPA